MPFALTVPTDRRGLGCHGVLPVTASTICGSSVSLLRADTSADVLPPRGGPATTSLRRQRSQPVTSSIPTTPLPGIAVGVQLQRDGMVPVVSCAAAAGAA